MATNPITWQSLSNHNLPDPTKLMALGQESMNAGMAGFQKMTDNYLQGQQNIADKAKVTNTDNFMNDLQGIKTPEEFALMEAQLRGQIRSGGENIDARSTQAALDGRMAVLQQRNIANMQYGNAVVEQADAPNRDLALSLYAQGNFAGGDAAAASVQRNKAALFEASRTGQRRAVTEGQADTTFNRSGEKHTADLAHQAEQERIARGTLAVSQANAENQRLAHVTTANNASVNAVTNQLKESKGLVEAMNESTKVAQSDPYAKPVDMSPGSPLVTQWDTQFDAKGQGADIMNKLSQARFTIPVWSGEGKDRKITGSLPINPPQAILDKAAANVSNRWLEGITPKWRTADSVVNEVRNLLNDENEVKNIQNAQRTLALAKDSRPFGTANPEATVPVATPAEGARAILAGATAATSAPQASSWLPDVLNVTNKTPKVNTAGDMVFSRNGFNFSTDRGVSPPKNIPMGALTTKVLDGDTVRITGEDGKSMDIRIGGGDAQEIAHKGKEGQAGGKAGLEYLTKSLMNSGRTQLVFTDNKTDKNGRHVARLLVNGKDYTKAAIADGVMVPLDIGNSVGDQADNAALLKEAIRNGKGMFNNPDPTNILLPALNRASGQAKY